MPAAEREPLLARLRTRFQTDVDSGVHAAAEWALRKWGQPESPTADTRTPADVGRAWSITPAGDTLVTIRTPNEFMVGTPVGSPDRDPTNEGRHPVHVPRTFAMAAKEVTVRQFAAFRDANPRLNLAHDPSNGPDPDAPVGGVTWYEMAQYCRWRSEQEGLPEDEIGWPPLDELRPMQHAVAPGMHLKPYFLSRTGYRLPTEAEWEFACRGTTETSYSFGEALDLLPRYAWFLDSAGGMRRPSAGCFPTNRGYLTCMEISRKCAWLMENIPNRQTPFGPTSGRPNVCPTISACGAVRGTMRINGFGQPPASIMGRTVTTSVWRTSASAWRAASPLPNCSWYGGCGGGPTNCEVQDRPLQGKRPSVRPRPPTNDSGPRFLTIRIMPGNRLIF